MRRRRLSIRLTAFGLLLLSVLMVGGFFSPVVADPEVTGVAWTALATIFVVGLLWPIAALLVVQVRVVSCPSDATVGRLMDLGLELRGIGGGIDLRVVGRGQPWRSADVPDDVLLPVTPASRGRFDEMRIEVQLSGPLGIVRARRSVVVGLPQTMWIAPAATTEQWRPDTAVIGETTEASSAAASSVGDAVRSTRPYRSGDPVHLVHWPSTARTGSLVVREMDAPNALGVAVVVALAGTLGDDDAVSRAAGLVRAIQVWGGPIVLCIHDESGPRAVAVTSVLEADRMLAVASPGPPGEAPPGWPTAWVRA